MKDSFITLSYCFENPESKSGYTTKSVTQHRNPRKALEYDVERVFESVKEQEKKPIIFVGFIIF